MYRFGFILFLITTGYSQVNWNTEIIDSMIFVNNEFNYAQNSLALDNSEVPHIVYSKFDMLIHATKAGTDWQRELVDSSLFYACCDLLFDDNNIAHLTYFRKDDSLNMTYLCYAQRDTTDWTTEVVDSIYGIVTNYWFSWGYYRTSLAFDMFGLPGIAYVSWNLDDSLHYLKYAHFNGITWDTSVVEYDSAWPYTVPPDRAPVLQFNNENEPTIAFHQIYTAPHDTIKIARFDNGSDRWISEPVICEPFSGAHLSYKRNSHDEPCIAHGYYDALVYSWRDNGIWYTEFTGDLIGVQSIRIELELDSLDNPHIFYHGLDPAHYCYKNNDNWYLCGQVDSSIENLGDISLTLDALYTPHISFRFGDWDSIIQENVYGIKYGEGTFTGIQETHTIQPGNVIMNIDPNITTSGMKISLALEKPTFFTLRLYNIMGCELLDFFTGQEPAGLHFYNFDMTDFSNGVYFIQFRTQEYIITEKIVKIR